MKRHIICTVNLPRELTTIEAIMLVEQTKEDFQLALNYGLYALSTG